MLWILIALFILFYRMFQTKLILNCNFILEVWNKILRDMTLRWIARRAVLCKHRRHQRLLSLTATHDEAPSSSEGKDKDDLVRVSDVKELNDLLAFETQVDRRVRALEIEYDFRAYRGQAVPKVITEKMRESVGALEVEKSYPTTSRRYCQNFFKFRIRCFRQENSHTTAR